MKKCFVVKLFLLVFFVSVCLISLPNIAAAQKEIKMNYSNFFPAPHKNSVLADQWCKEIEKRTNGRVKITIFHGGTLTPAPQVYDGVVKGLSDVGMSVLAYTPGRFPLIEVIDLPLGYKNATVATNLINEFYKKFKPKEFDDVQVMYLHAHGPGFPHTKKPVAKLEDLKGMKIRAHGFSAKVVTALGAAPVGMAMGETYDALSKGVVEGVMAPMEALEGWKWGDLVKYSIYNTGASYTTGFFVVMNKAKWNALPKDIQQIITKINEEWIPKQAQTWDAIDEAGKIYAAKLGNKFAPLSPEESARWAQAVKPLLDGYVTTATAKGVPGDQALKFCQDYLKKYNK
jgi:TRAP-type C4-dicarboxylate transport system substrate-binding protein